MICTPWPYRCFVHTTVMPVTDAEPAHKGMVLPDTALRPFNAHNKAM